MSLTIIAKSGKLSRISPLLLSLVNYRPKEDYELFVLSKQENSKKLLDELNCFRSAIKWKLFVDNENGEMWWDLINTKKVLSLPVSSIPYKDSINQLLDIKDVGNFKPLCKTPSALFALISDKYSSNITENVYSTCEAIESDIWYSNCFGEESVKTKEFPSSNFITPESKCTALFKVSLLETNVNNLKITTK